MTENETLNLFADEEKYIKGRHIMTIFHNAENLYSVIRIRIDETNVDYKEKEVVIVGHFPQIHEEETYVFYGDFKNHPRFGKQFNATRFKKELPQTKQGVISYLSGELFKGIGKKTAENIVNTLGNNAISKILENPSSLDSVPRLRADTAKNLYDTLVEHEGLENIMIALNDYGFGPQLSMKIYQVYKEQTLTIIESNPYQLVEDVEGVGFGRADELGAQLGITGTHPDRLKAACLYMLDKICLQAGHVYLFEEELINKVIELLTKGATDEINYDLIEGVLIQLEEESKLVVEGDKVYIPSLYYAEEGLVSNIRRLLLQTDNDTQFPESEFLLSLGKFEEQTGVEYAKSQKIAIQTALSSPLLILTGGPGTGKTTVIKAIVEMYSKLNGLSLDSQDYFVQNEPFPFVLAAPTGRAAKRMSESTGLPAVTIHRLLGWNGLEGFEHDEDNPLQGELFIIDEMSMVDIWLANQLFKALPDNAQVILVGDEDQLPSVGPGQVLTDLLRSKLIPMVSLTEIFRQEEGSSIVELAHFMKKGILPNNVTERKRDSSFFPCMTDQVVDVVTQVVSNALAKGYSPLDIQVLAPMYRGQAGIDRLNKKLQEVVNPNDDGSRKEMKFGEVAYRIGDKVLQLVNNPEENVFNGDIGQIVAIFTAKENVDKQEKMIVSFDGIEVEYTRQDLIQITHAFCCSVHKAQGSEFPIVIFPVVRSYHRMLKRNLIYTAITRSQRYLILCGELSALQDGVERIDSERRQTTLCERLTNKLVDMPADGLESYGNQDSEQRINATFVKESQANLDALNQSDLVTGTNENKEKEKNNLEKDRQINESLTYEQRLMKVDPLIGMGNITPYDFLNKS